MDYDEWIARGGGQSPWIMVCYLVNEAGQATIHIFDKATHEYLCPLDAEAIREQGLEVRTADGCAVETPIESQFHCQECRSAALARYSGQVCEPAETASEKTQRQNR
jgi:hypothetical protein